MLLSQRESAETLLHQCMSQLNMIVFIYWTFLFETTMEPVLCVQSNLQQELSQLLIGNSNWLLLSHQTLFCFLFSFRMLPFQELSLPKVIYRCMSICYGIILQDFLQRKFLQLCIRISTGSSCKCQVRSYHHYSGSIFFLFFCFFCL